MKRKSVFFALFMILGVSFLSAQQGTLKNIRGKVQISNDGGASFKDAAEGASVVKSTVIKLSPVGSKATLVIGSSSIDLKPSTILSVEELEKKANGDEKVSVAFSSGEIDVKVSDKSRRKYDVDFSAKSPNATASVRGTRFVMNTRGIKVTEGTVLFTGLKDRKTLTVETGMEAQVTENGNTAFVSRAGDARVPAPPPSAQVNSQAINGPSQPLPPPPPSITDAPITWQY